MGKTHYTRREASQLLNKSGAEIRRMVATGELRYEHVEGRWMIPARDLEELLEGFPSEASTEGKQDERTVEHQREGLSEEADTQDIQPWSVANAFVSYLNRYITVSPEHEAAFDEFSSRSDPPSGTKLELGTRIEDFVRQCFTLPKPPSIILTGNAGDGKTYLCRQVIETFSGRRVTDWTNHADWHIERNGLTMRVVKDLSETTEDAGAEVLQELALTLRAEEPQSVFLIAANEGRLRSVLERREQLKELNERVDRQLREGPDVDDECLIVFDLNKVTTSAYVPETLRWLTDPSHWQACESCPAFDGCPIRFNANRLAEEHISDRLALTYRTLEHLDVHATIRDMLIHLAYTVTGGLSCEEVIEQHHDPGHTLHRRVYYENCWGTEAAPANRRKMSVVNHLRHFDVGNYSFFEVDDFIIYGDEAGSEAVRNEHKRLFAANVDLKGEYFAQRRRAYLRGKVAVSNAEETDELLGLLPHCRRKLFFEWHNVEAANQLTPFLFFPEYLDLLTGDHGKLERAKEKLVVGLNRALTGLYLTDKDILYVTSQYAHAVEQPVPVVRVKIPALLINLEAERPQLRAMDCERPILCLRISNPRFATDPIPAEINLLRFEYLMRLARGGTHNVLADECNLFVRELKDKLLSSFGTMASQEDRIEFFGVTGNRYALKTLRVDEQGKIRP